MLKRLLFVFTLTAALPLQTLAATIPVDPNLSSVSTDKTEVKADGIDSAKISVTLKNTNFGSVEGAVVTLTSSRGAMDDISPDETTTSLSGRASFYVKSLKNGTATFTPSYNGTTLNKPITITFKNGLDLALPVGSLIKIPDDNNATTLSDTAVYYYASNGKRYVFTNEKTFFSWYPDFSSVQTITLEQMSLIPIGGNVTYKPGSRLVKFQTDTKTYLPTKGGVLRWVMTEQVARQWFGADWNTKVDDISEAFFVNYQMGEPIGNALDLSPEGIRAQVTTIDKDLGF
ncbi:MAG: Ig-like domain-containing protein [Patescibacteria group bacterium]